MTDTDTVPHELSHVEALTNSMDVEAGTDALTSPDELRDWLVARDLLAAGAEVTASDLETARHLRAGLRDVLRGHQTGDLVDPAAVARLNAAVGSLPMVARVHAAGRVGLAAAVDDAAGALATVVAGVVQASVSGTWERLKICPEDTCGWVFYDRSKNRSRRWCTMDVCGNRAKTRGYRARRRATA